MKREFFVKKPITFTTDYGGEWTLVLQESKPIREIDWADVEHLVESQAVHVLTPSELRDELEAAFEAGRERRVIDTPYDPQGIPWRDSVVACRPDGMTRVIRRDETFDDWYDQHLKGRQ